MRGVIFSGHGHRGGSYSEGEETEGGHFGQVKRSRGVILEGVDIERGHFWKVGRLRGVI